MAPSSVPAGQMNLQKAGSGVSWASPNHRGRAMTNTASTIYFSQVSVRVTADFRIFGVGIRWRSSWIHPRGQSHPQTVRPSITPKSRRMPKTYHPALWPAEARAF